MELHEALGSISEIRAQLARTETLRDFRSLTVGFSGITGIGAAFVQAQSIPDPAEQVWDYVDLWGAVAVVNLLVVGVELACRWFASKSSLNRSLITSAIRQFTPCLAAGAVVTVIVAMRAQEIAWILPGMWAILFSLGVFACCRLLPRATIWVGLHYMAAGAICLMIGSSPYALSPWMMVGTFGVGQILAAAILYCTLERNHGETEARAREDRPFCLRRIGSSAAREGTAGNPEFVNGAPARAAVHRTEGALQLDGRQSQSTHAGPAGRRSG